MYLMGKASPMIVSNVRNIIARYSSLNYLFPLISSMAVRKVCIDRTSKERFLPRN